MAVEYHHCLDVRRVRKEIEGIRAIDGVAGVDDAARVAGEGGDVARHVDEPRRGELDDRFERLGRQTGPRRITVPEIGARRTNVPGAAVSAASAWTAATDRPSSARARSDAAWASMTSRDAPAWHFGARALMRNLAARGLLSQSKESIPCPTH